MKPMRAVATLVGVVVLAVGIIVALKWIGAGKEEDVSSPPPSTSPTVSVATESSELSNKKKALHETVNNFVSRYFVTRGDTQEWTPRLASLVTANFKRQFPAFQELPVDGVLKSVIVDEATANGELSPDALQAHVEFRVIASVTLKGSRTIEVHKIPHDIVLGLVFQDGSWRVNQVN